MVIRVVVADDHALVRRGTREILAEQPDLDVVADVADGLEAVEAAVAHLPAVVLMDLGMPRMNGIDATRAIKERHPEVAVVMLTVHDDAVYAMEAIRAGASGFLRKDVDDTALVEAVRTAAAGGAVLDPTLTARVLHHVQAPEAPTLTARQLDVLRLVADGHPNREIAAALQISERTVEVHLSNVYRSLGVASRTEAVMRCIKLGLVDVGEVGGATR